VQTPVVDEVSVGVADEDVEYVAVKEEP